MREHFGFDQSFSAEGWPTAIPFYLPRGDDKKIIALGACVLVGNSSLPTDKYFIARYSESGVLDNSFNSTGYNLFSLGVGNNVFNSILTQQDGKLVATGYTQIGNLAYSAIVRFHSQSLGQPNFGKLVKFYPNPTGGIVLFDNSDYSFTRLLISNNLGQVVRRDVGFGPNENLIDLSPLSSGVYIFKLEGTFRENTFPRIVKQ